MATGRPLIAIVGPTASGKTGLAIVLAERYDGEIICADSRTVYKHMDIGTAKPTADEQARVRHWGLDLVEPNEAFSAADFKRYATATIADIRARGKVPFLVGGTGLYIDAVLYDFNFGPPATTTERSKFEAMTLEALHQYCDEHNIPLPENHLNKRYVIRAIERNSISTISKRAIAHDSYVVGIATNKEQLRTRIIQRTEQLFENGVEEEATILGRKYGWESEAMTGNIYPLLKLHLEGQLSAARVKEQFTTLDYRLAKRQMTWFRRNPDIMWARLSEVEGYIQSVLAAE